MKVPIIGAPKDRFNAIFGRFPQEVIILGWNTNLDELRASAEKWIRKNSQEWAMNRGFEITECELVINLELARGHIKATTSPTGSPESPLLVLPN